MRPRRRTRLTPERRMPYAGHLRRAKAPSAARASHAGDAQGSAESGAPRLSQCRPLTPSAGTLPPDSPAGTDERPACAEALRLGEEAVFRAKPSQVRRSSFPIARAPRRDRKTSRCEASERRSRSAKNGPFARITSCGQAAPAKGDQAGPRRRHAGRPRRGILPPASADKGAIQNAAGRRRFRRADARAASSAAEEMRPSCRGESAPPPGTGPGGGASECRNQSSTTISLGSITSGRQVGANSFRDSTNKSAFCASTGKVR